MQKIIVIVVVLAILVGGFFYFSSTVPTPSENDPAGTIPATTEVTQDPPATGNINDAITAIEQDALFDEPSAAESDPTLTDPDESAAGFGEALDASTF